MYGTKKALVIVIAVGLAVFLIALVLYGLLDLNSMMKPNGIAAIIIGGTAGEFSMKACLLAVLATVFLVPSIRSEFTGSYSAGADYKQSHKGKGGRRI